MHGFDMIPTAMRKLSGIVAPWAYALNNNPQQNILAFVVKSNVLMYRYTILYKR